MSIASQITRINTNIAAAYYVCEEKGAVLPQEQNSANLASTINSIIGDDAVVNDPALRLIDWNGTLLKTYTREEALSLTALPNSTGKTHVWLSFQSWNRTLSSIKTWLNKHRSGVLDVGAIYVTLDFQNHNYWNNPRLNAPKAVSIVKRGSAALSDSSYKDCFSLENISFSNNEVVGQYAFQNCRSLKAVNIPPGCVSINNGAFQGCYSLTKATLPEGLAVLSDNSFRSCFSLKSIILPEGMTTINNTAFQGCYSMVSVELPETITNIGYGAFKDCYSLTSIVLPKNIETIYSTAFGDCTTLNDVVVLGKPSLYDIYVFSNGPDTRRYYVPRENLEWFSSATNWSTMYSQIYAIEDYIEYLESIGVNVDEYKEEL